MSDICVSGLTCVHAVTKNLPFTSPPPAPRESGQEPLNGGVDVPPGGDERLQVGLVVDEAHGVELVQLLLETNLGGPGLRLEVRRQRRTSCYDRLYLWREERLKPPDASPH